MPFTFCMLKSADGREDIAVNPESVAAVRPGQGDTSFVAYQGGEVEVGGGVHEVVLKLLVTNGVELSQDGKATSRFVS